MRDRPIRDYGARQGTLFTVLEKGSTVAQNDNILRIAQPSGLQVHCLLVYVPATTTNLIFRIGGYSGSNSELTCTNAFSDTNYTSLGFGISITGQFSGTQKCWKNGRVLASGNFSTGTAHIPYEGQDKYHYVGAGSDTKFYLSYFWGRFLSDSEHAQLHADPYCFLQRGWNRRYYIPAAGGGNTIDVPAGSLTLSAQTPTVTATANNTIEVPLATLTLSGQTPTVTASDHKTVDVPIATLTLTGNAPDVSVGANTTIEVPAGSLSLTSFNPTITATANVEISVPLSTLTVTGYNPTVTFTGHVTVDVPLSTLTLTRYSPSVSNGSAPAATEARLFKLMGGFPSGLTSEGGGLK